MVGIQIGEHHDRKTVVRIAGYSAGKALPGSAVLNALVIVLLADHPATSITSGIWLAVVEGIHGPNAVQAGLLEELRAIQRGIPLGQIEHAEIQRAVGCRVERRRDPRLILELGRQDQLECLLRKAATRSLFPQMSRLHQLRVALLLVS